MSCCNSGNTFHTPTPGQLLVVPPGSQAVQIPTVYGCGGDAESARGQVIDPALSAGAGLGSGWGYPTVKSDFSAPALDAMGGFYSANALYWAVAGASAWIAPIGYVTITGVSGELVSFRNVNLPQGTLIRAGATILVTPPAISAGAGGGGNSTPVEANALDRLGGILENQPRYLPGANGDLLRNVNGRWQSSAGRVYSPLAVPVDVAPVTLQPWGGTGDLITTVTLNLPGLPTPLPPSFGAIMTARVKQSGHNSDVEIKVAGQPLAAVRTANDLEISTAIIRCTSATPQLVVSRPATAQPIINVLVSGYFL